MLLEFYAAVRKHAKTEFVTRHPRPFVVYAGIAPPHDLFTTATGMHSIELARIQGTSDVAIATETLVQPLIKSPRNPFLDQIYVGRADNNDIIIDAESVSKSHAYFKLVGDVWNLFDMESRNGTRVGEQALAPYQAAPVLDGQTVTFGDIVCQFYLPESFHTMVASKLK